MNALDETSSIDRKLPQLKDVLSICTIPFPITNPKDVKAVNEFKEKLIDSCCSKENGAYSCCVKGQVIVVRR